MIAALATAILRLAGWKCALAPLPGPKGIIVVYPHTSNWDFPVGYLYKLATGLPLSWVGKDSLFRWPVGGLLRRMNGIPVGLAFIDYRTRVVGIREYVTLSGDREADMARIRQAYVGMVGKHPELAGGIQLEP